MTPLAVQTIPQTVAWWAERTPEAPALVPGADHAAPVSYGELNERAAILARLLATWGIDRGDLVAIDATNRVDAVIAMVATMHVGAALPLFSGASDSDLHAVFARLEPRLCIATDRGGAAARAALAANVPVLLGSGDGFDPADRPGVPGTGDDLALVLHSSGTTGAPRGILRTHRNLLAAAAAHESWVGRETLARVLMPTPLAFGMGAHALCATLCAGGAAILPGCSPDAILRAIDHWRPTWAYVVPALLEAILEGVGQTGRLAASGWQRMGVAGMAPSRTLADRVETVFGLSLAEGYGCGEAGLIAGTMRAGTRSPGVMDRVFAPGIATVDNRGAPTAPGVPGEIVVWGPQVSAAYLGDAQATAVSFAADGTFRTGDIGVLDDTGRLHLVGRVKEIINRGGEKLAPEEIEAVLKAHPAVVEAAVFPVPHARLGEEVAAAVIPRPGAVVTERDLRRHVANHLALAKVPHHVWFVDALPRTATGKIRRGDLATRFGSARRVEFGG